MASAIGCNPCKKYEYIMSEDDEKENSLSEESIKKELTSVNKIANLDKVLQGDALKKSWRVGSSLIALADTGGKIYRIFPKPTPQITPKVLTKSKTSLL